MKFYGLSNTGKVRGNNEDFYHVPAKEEKYNLFIVADGMGGACAGEVASALAVADTVEFVNKYFNEYEDKALLLRKAISNANKTVYDTSRTEHVYESMGTTLVAALESDGKVFVANVGDSRCYIASENQMQQVSVDHSFVQELVNKGMLTKEEAKHHPDRNVITRAIGTQKHVAVDVFCREAKEGDRILLTSDGLTSMLEEEYIEEILLSGDDPKQIVKTLVEKANDAGGKDNITAVVVIN